ncbi:hypothetical protein ABZS53_15440 [Streptomyces sp. NPDC005499]|uniref:hypothetical protein n=1 Tax=Streptomyces sp. NPDC005499 TaxID=3154883 RepID=UPI0033A3636F
MTDIEAPRLITPEGGAQPESPQEYHDHPYVWAWNVILGATSRDFIERECLAADRDGAPPDAVYKTRDDDPSMPGEWVTVGMLTNADQQRRVREYAHALVDHHEALHELGKQQKAQPPQEGDEPEQPEVAEEPEQYEYKVSFVARISGKVTAASYEEAMQQLAPPEHTADSGYVGGLATALAGVVWFLNFDSRAGDLVTTNDPRMQKPQAPPAPAVEPAVSSPSQVRPTATRGVVIRRLNPPEPPK